LGIFTKDYLVQDRTQQQYFPVPDTPFTSITHWLIQGSKTINLNDGDTLRVRFENDKPDFTDTSNGSHYDARYIIAILGTSNFSCNGNTTGGGNYQKYDPSDYPIYQDSFEIELNKTKFDLIAQRPLSLIEFSQGVQSTKRGWIDELRYNHLKGIGTFKLLSAKNTN